MEIRQLEAFSAVVISGSVTAAGKLLGRSQPVISRLISELERELGLVLFERTRPNITLTPVGDEFYRDVRNILGNIQQLEARAHDLRAGLVRPMRILAASDLARGLLPRALAHAERTTPVFHHKLIIEEVPHEAGASQIRECRPDFALINMPIDFEDMKMHWCGQAPCMLALPASHALAGKSQVRLEDIVNTDVISLLDSYRMRHHLISSLVRATADKSRRHIQVGHQGTALAMVRAGLGVALADPFSLHGVKLDGIELRPLNIEVQYMIGVVSLASEGLSAGALRLIHGLHDYVRKNVAAFADTDPYGLQIDNGAEPAPHMS